MLDLKNNLESRDLGGLQILSMLWGLDLKASDVRQAKEILTNELLKADLSNEIIAALPENSHSALIEISRAGGRMPWSKFTRSYGGVREMGAARRDRERPYSNEKASPAEALWYRGLVGRAFFSTKEGPIEYAYIPDEFLGLLNDKDHGETSIRSRPASSAEKKLVYLANDSILDDACTLLAALRMGVWEDSIDDMFLCSNYGAYRLSQEALVSLLKACDLLDDNDNPIPEQTRMFLEMDRSDALVFMVRCWRKSNNFNELMLIPNLGREGEWINEPLSTREIILDLLNSILYQDSEMSHNIDRVDNSTIFWSLEAFVSSVQKINPDFQRPSGDYDSWYIRDLASGEFIRGYQQWDMVDGEFLRFFVTGVLHWLGIVDIAFSQDPAIDKQIDRSEMEKPPIPTAFRFSKNAAKLAFVNTDDPIVNNETTISKDVKIILRGDGRVRIPSNSPRVARYQIARFCEWQGYKDGFYRYKITSSSLNSAKDGGLNIHHLIALMRRYAESIPPNLEKALNRWDMQGNEAHIEQLIVLRVREPSILEQLLRSRASRYLGDIIGPTTVVVRQGAINQIHSALAEMGLLSSIEIDK